MNAALLIIKLSEKRKKEKKSITDLGPPTTRVLLVLIVLVHILINLYMRTFNMNTGLLLLLGVFNYS